MIESNRKVTQGFIAELQRFWQEDTGHIRRTEDQKHFVCEIDLQKAFDDFLMKLKFTRGSDSGEFTSLGSVILRYLETQNNRKATIYLMTKGKARKHTLTKKDIINNLFQGKNPKTGEVIYPSDGEIKNFANLTIQIHNLNLVNENTGEVFEHVYSIAVWMPEEMNKNIIRLGKKLA